MVIAGWDSSENLQTLATIFSNCFRFKVNVTLENIEPLLILSNVFKLSSSYNFDLTKGSITVIYQNETEITFLSLS